MVGARARLGERVEERVDGRSHPLVLLRLVRGLHVRRRERVVARWRQPERSLDERQPQPLEGGDGEVAIEVVAVRRVDVLAKPHARVVDLELRLGHRRAELGCGPEVQPSLLDEAEGASSPERTRLEPTRDQAIVVVARHHDDLSGAQRRELCERRLGDIHRLGEGSVAEFEDVAEQHQAIDALDRVGKGAEGLGPGEKVGFRGRAEVEVRDDRSPHAAPILPCRG